MTAVLLGRHLSVHLDEGPAPESRIELVFTSQTRQVRVSGPYARELYRLVLPLLNGRWSLPEIATQAAAAVPRDVTEEFIGELSRRHLVAEIESPTSSLAAGQHQATISWLQEAQIKVGPALTALRSSSVAVVGVSRAGAFAARSLASAGVGRLILIDRQGTAPEGRSAASPFPFDCVGSTETLVQEITRTWPATSVSLPKPERSPTDVLADPEMAIDRVLLCRNDQDDDLAKRVGDVCRARNIEWTSCAVRAWEGVVGPTFSPSYSPCFRCYAARQIDPVLRPANANSPSGSEAMVFGHSVIGGLAALEIVRGITDTETSRGGRLHIVDFWNLVITPHRFLPQPWCEVCLNLTHQP